MPTVKLNKVSLKQLKSSNKITDYFDQDIKGFLVRVMPSGTMSYGLLYRNSQRKLKRYTIAKCSKITLINAKKEAQRLLLLISQGLDIQQDKVRKSELNEGNTFIDYL
ncbi:Arm DNA-binding domain-containing protein, partial [Francisellaceae bacterium]|nr:Arm DNA-binding domain-containing protein [Francisellaceae bacterium]